MPVLLQLPKRLSGNKLKRLKEWHLRSYCYSTEVLTLDRRVKAIELRSRVMVIQALNVVLTSVYALECS